MRHRDFATTEKFDAATGPPRPRKLVPPCESAEFAAGPDKAPGFGPQSFVCESHSASRLKFVRPAGSKPANLLKAKPSNQYDGA